jgi:hypothetical protein
MAIYNLTEIDANNTMLGLIIGINDLSNKMLFSGGTLSIFIIILATLLFLDQGFPKSFAVSSIGVLFLSILLLFAGLINWYILSFYIALTVVSVFIVGFNR